MTTQTLKNWQEEKIGNLLLKVKKQKKVKRGDYLSKGLYPVIDQGDDLIGGYTENEDDLFNGNLPAIIFGDHTRRFKWVNFPFAIGADGTQILVPKENLDRRFFFYALKAAPLKNYGYQRHFKYLKDLQIEFPDKKGQEKIASVLSIYDDLTENNTRRIQILEQMAQAIYSEWFGSADSDSWKISSLGEQLSELQSGSRPKGGVVQVENGIPSVGAENINGIGKHNYGSEKFIPRSFFEKMKRGKVRDGDVAIYKDGAYIGRSSYFRDSFPHKTFAVNEHVFLLRTTGENITQNFLYIWLRQPETIHSIRATNANAAQPGINQTSIRGLKIFLPPQNEVREFDRLVEPVFATITNLAKQNNNLRQARDLLLPKLVSGEIEVK